VASVDLNADLGESYGRWQLGDDAALLPHLSSANVACGFHAGDPLTLRRTVTAAVEAGVAVGAQVGYPDLVGFGRRAMDLSPDELEADVLYQLSALDGLCRAAGGAVRYLKPHGALYHRTLDDQVQAAAVVAALVAHGGGLPVLTLAGSALAVAASAEGLRVVTEGFADRAYGDDGRLVPRTEPGALLEDPSAAAEQAVALATSGTVDSICVHGDTPGAPRIARAVRAALAGADVDVAPFA
jgi:UPF0271 protein